MKKAKSNASWNRLTPKQRETLDRWLFEENLSYKAVLPKAERELGYKGSETSLRRYYERRQQERLLTDLKEVGRDMTEVRGLDTDADASRKASMQVLGAYLFRVLRAAPDKVKEWAPVANLIVQNDHNEAWRSIKGEEQKFRREALEFAKGKFQFDMAKRALEALPELLELAEAKRDPAITEYEENIRLNRAVREMFGPLASIHPESAKEAKEMLAAKREREARQQAEQEAAAERHRIQDEIGEAQPPPPSSPYYEEYLAAKAEQEAEEREWEKKRKERQTRAASAVPEEEKAAQEKLRGQREEEARLEELREVCGWQEVERPPGSEAGT